MKKYIYTAAMSAMLLAASCSSDNTINNEPENIAGTQSITLIVADGQISESRSGRPLESSEPLQAVENVKVIVTTAEGEVVWTKLLDSWNSANVSKPLQSVECENGREAVVEIPKEEYYLEEDMNYFVYAFGYSNFSDYDLSAIIDANVGDSFNPDFTIPLKRGVGEELFAGRNEVVGNPNGVNTQLVLNRQVAGTYGYFQHIPYIYDPATKSPGRYLHLVASNPQKEMVLGMFAADYVVNGVRDAESRVIYTIDLANWFIDITEGVDEYGVKTGIIPAGSNWKGYGDNASLRFANGSVFAGDFIIPFEKTEEPTFKIVLTTDMDAKNILRSWEVLLPAEGADQLQHYSYWKFIDKSWTRPSTADTDRVYNVLRNHLYGVGKHPFAVLRDDVDPSDPELEDLPVSLNNKQELGLVVNHNWQAIYLMDLD